MPILEHDILLEHRWRWYFTDLGHLLLNFSDFAVLRIRRAHCRRELLFLGRLILLVDVDDWLDPTAVFLGKISSILGI